MLLNLSSAVRTRAIAAVCALATCLTAAPAWADSDVGKGVGLDRVFGISGAFGFGQRFGESGKAFSLRAEGAGYFMRTPMNNRGGIEGGMELGYDGMPDHDPPAVLTGFLWDLWLGFPITVFETGGEKGPTFSAAIAPGMGMSWQHAYVYIKGKVAARVAEKIVVEVNYQWTPYMGSYPFLTGTSAYAGISMATLRAAVHFNLNDDMTLFTYFDWKQSNLEEPQSSSNAALQAFAGAPYASHSFQPLQRTPEDNNFRLGVGLAF